MFKTYISTINDIKGEKTIDLSYLIHSGREIAVIRMLSNNIQYEIVKPHTIMDPISDTKKLIPIRTYAGRELHSMLEGMVKLAHFEADDQVIKMNKLMGITEMTFNLNELDNCDNLKDGSPGNTLLTYHVTADKDFTHFEPATPQYKKLKNGEFVSLSLRITNQKNNIITDGPKVIVVLHICDCKS